MQIVCLANSWKEGGRCIAGINTATGKWVRPVSKLETGALTDTQCSASDGRLVRAVRPLDIVEIGASIPAPELGQPENHALGSTAWSIVGKISADSLLDFVVAESPLLHGTTDRVVETDVGGVRASLALIHVEEPRFEARFLNSRTQLRVNFHHGGVEYNLSVTDSQEWVGVARHDPDRYSQGHWLFTISLGVTFRGHRYKLAACGLKL